MNFSIHIDDPLARTLDALARQSGKTRNALIREALRVFVARFGKTQWPTQVKALAGADPALVPFEDSRRELTTPLVDPLE